MLNLMHDILQSTQLSPSQYDNFYKWLCALADKEGSAEGDIHKSIINLLIHISNKSDYFNLFKILTRKASFFLHFKFQK